MSAPDVDPAIYDAMIAVTTNLGDDYDLHPHTAAVVAQRIRDEAVANERTRQVDTMNAEYGCPDCGVHHACGEIVAERDVLRSLVAKLMKGEVGQLTTGDLYFWIHHAGQRIRRDVALTRDEATVLAAIREGGRG